MGQFGITAGRAAPSFEEVFDREPLAAARGLYDPALPYHNFDHALRAVAAGDRLVAACAASGFVVDASVVRLALLFHDAGYGTEPRTVGCVEAEAYSAALARRALSARLAEPVLLEVEAAILATRRRAVPEGLEGQVVRAADLMGLAADYATFAANSTALRIEQEYLTGVPVSRPGWRDCVEQVVNGYLAERLWPVELLDLHQDGSRFHALARANLDRYVASLVH